MAYEHDQFPAGPPESQRPLTTLERFRREAPRCKGDWSLGTACGECPRCLDEAREYIKSLSALRAQELNAYARAHEASRAEIEQHEHVLAQLAAVLPQDASEFSPLFVRACFNEARRIVHGEVK